MDSTLSPNQSTVQGIQTEITVSELWQAAVLEWSMILKWTVLAAIAATLLTFVLPVTYRAEVLLAPASPTGDKDKLGGLAGLASQFGGIASMAGISIPQNDSKEIAIATLGSQLLTDSYVQDENLMPILFAGRWDQQEKKWKPGWLTQKDPTLQDANKLFLKKVRKISQDKLTGLVTLTITWRDPNQAAKWANDIVSKTNKFLRDRAVAESNRNIEYLQQRIASTSIVEIQQTLAGLMASEIKNAMVAQGNNEYAFRVIDPAVVPEERYFPKRSLFAVLGSILGLISSATYAFLKHQKQSESHS